MQKILKKSQRLASGSRLNIVLLNCEKEINRYTCFAVEMVLIVSSKGHDAILSDVPPFANCQGFS